MDCVWADIQTTNDHSPRTNQFDNIAQYLQNPKLLITKCQQNAKAQVCERLKQYHELSTILQSVLDITATIVKIMECVCIHQCKCQKAMDVIIYAFLHFDEFADRPCGHNRKQIRKDDFQCDLRRDCCFTKQETKITYAITKYAFQAFYYKQIVTRFDDSFIDECIWIIAAKKTIKAYKLLDGVDTTSINTFSANVNCAYKNYLERRREKINQSRSKYECCCNQNRSNKPGWLHQLCSTGKQPCSGLKTGKEFTKKDCTCVCDETEGRSNAGGRSNADAPEGDAAKINVKVSDNEIKIKALYAADCMKLKTCEEQLKCVQDKLLNMEKEKQNREAEMTKLKQEGDRIKADAAAYNDLVKKLGPDYDPVKLATNIKTAQERTEFSVYLKFYESGKNCQIDLTGLALSKEFITQVSGLKITNDANDRPVNFQCVQT